MEATHADPSSMEWPATDGAESDARVRLQLLMKPKLLGLRLDEFNCRSWQSLTGSWSTDCREAMDQRSAESATRRRIDLRITWLSMSSGKIDKGTRLRHSSPRVPGEYSSWIVGLGYPFGWKKETKDISDVPRFQPMLPLKGYMKFHEELGSRNTFHCRPWSRTQTSEFSEPKIPRFLVYMADPFTHNL